MHNDDGRDKEEWIENVYTSHPERRNWKLGLTAKIEGQCLVCGGRYHWSDHDLTLSLPKDPTRLFMCSSVCWRYHKRMRVHQEAKACLIGAHNVLKQAEHALDTILEEIAAQDAQKMEQQVSAPRGNVCPHPEKHTYGTERDAWFFIFHKYPNDKYIRPYRCQCGQLHIGHNNAKQKEKGQRAQAQAQARSCVGCGQEIPESRIYEHVCPTVDT